MSETGVVELSSQFDDVATLDQAEKAMPDVHTHPEYYGVPEANRRAIEVISTARKKPNKPVMVYHSEPELKPDDTVSTQRDALSDYGDVYASVVPARHVALSGNALWDGSYIGPRMMGVGTHRESTQDIIAKYDKIDAEMSPNFDETGGRTRQFWGLADERQDTEHLEELTKDIARHGIRNPIGVDYSTKPPTISDGHTRLIAAAVLGIKKVPTTPRALGEHEGGRREDDELTDEPHYPPNARFVRVDSEYYDRFRYRR